MTHFVYRCDWQVHVPEFAPIVRTQNFSNPTTEALAKWLEADPHPWGPIKQQSKNLAAVMRKGQHDLSIACEHIEAGSPYTGNPWFCWGREHIYGRFEVPISKTEKAEIEVKLTPMRVVELGDGE